jgi:hypothetical protein
MSRHTSLTDVAHIIVCPLEENENPRIAVALANFRMVSSPHQETLLVPRYLDIGFVPIWCRGMPILQ